MSARTKFDAAGILYFVGAMGWCWLARKNVRNLRKHQSQALFPRRYLLGGNRQPFGTTLQDAMRLVYYFEVRSKI